MPPPDARSRRKPYAIGVPACTEPQGAVRRMLRTTRAPMAWTSGAIAEKARDVMVREPEDDYVHGERK